MRLKRVRIFGFKTFADRTEFDLSGGVVAVVGPNGCGKSNLVDAILWGLGEGNARALRAQTGQDVIFSGSPKRKPVGFAEVTLLFDNEDGALPIDTPEVAITRRLTRAGDSEYSINKRVCRQRDIYDLLADSGLGRAGYAIVGQKEIDSALSASADDRRAWVDEAAGVQRYRTRKIESQRRLSQAKEHLERVHDILRELESQREPLKEEAEEAIRYKSLSASLREVEIGLLVQEIALATADFEEAERRLVESARLSREEVERAGRLEGQSRIALVRLGEVEAELELLRQGHQKLLTQLERLQADRRLAEQRLETIHEQETGLEGDAVGAEARIREAEAEHQETTLRAAEAATALSRLREELAGVGDAAKALANELKVAEEELERARRIQTLRLKAEAEEEHRANRRKLIKRELDGINATLPDLEAAIEEARNAWQEVASAGMSRQSGIEEAERAIARIVREEEADAAEVRKAMAERASLEGRKRGIEATIDAHEGLAQGPRAVMEAVERRLLDGRYIPVGEAVEAERDVALAIETALGGSANDLICDDPQDAKRAIEWLKANRAGRATFQPIPLMRTYERSYELKRMLGERGVVGVASDLVQCAGRNRPVIESLLGRVVIVETIDDALKLARTAGWSRLVTLEGEVVHSGGAVSGGQTRNQSYGLVQRKADLIEIEDELARLGTKIRDFEGRSADRRRKKDEFVRQAEALRNNSKENQSEVQQAHAFLQTLEGERKSALKEREKLERERSELDGLHRELPEVDVPAAEQRRDTALKAVAAKSADAEVAEQRLREAEDRDRHAKSQLEASTRRVRAAYEAEQIRARRAGNLGPEKERLQQEVARIQHEREQTEVQIADSEAKVEKAREARHLLQEEATELSTQAREARENAVVVGNAAHQSEVARTRADAKRTSATLRLADEYGLTYEMASSGELPAVPEDAQTIVNRLRREIRAMGDVNLGAIEAFERLSQRFEELGAQSRDIEDGMAQVEAAIRELDKLTRDRFLNTFAALEIEFSLAYQKLFGGGEGKIALSEPDNVLESGIDLLITLPGKRRQPLQLLSGGERSLAAMAFLFALLKVKPSPLVVLDEVDAPLDGRNVERFASALQDLTDRTQFIVITHNHTTIVSAGVLIGVAMQEPGISMLLPVRLPDAVQISNGPTV